MAKGGLHARHEGSFDLLHVLLELLACSYYACGEDKGADTEIHERGAKGFGLAKTTREDRKVDGEDGSAGDDHHGTAVAGDEGFDGERIAILILDVVFRDDGLAILVDFDRILSLRLQVGGDGWEKQESSKCLWRAGVDGR